MSGLALPVNRELEAERARFYRAIAEPAGMRRGRAATFEDLAESLLDKAMDAYEAGNALRSRYLLRWSGFADRHAKAIATGAA